MHPVAPSSVASQAGRKLEKRKKDGARVWRLVRSVRLLRPIGFMLRTVFELRGERERRSSSWEDLRERANHLWGPFLWYLVVVTKWK